jgi:hypothetical protein
MDTQATTRSGHALSPPTDLHTAALAVLELPWAYRPGGNDAVGA